jgi:hypothetical protein
LLLRYERAKPLTRRPLVLPDIRESAAFGIGFTQTLSGAVSEVAAPG